MRNEELGLRRRRFPYSVFRIPYSRGFTLVETLVVVSLFVVLLGSLGGIYLTFVRQHRGQAAAASLQQDLQNFFEVLDREVRTGFGTTFVTLAGDQEFALKNQNTECVKYGLGTGADAGRLVRVVSPTAGCDPTVLSLSSGDPLTARATEVRALYFRHVTVPTVDTRGTADPADDILVGQQGRVTVSLRACPRGRPDTDCIDVQTTITSRQHGVPPS